jgi:hypothetical protein
MLMRGKWTSVGSMYLGREMPLFFLLLSNPYSSKITSDDKIHPTFSSDYGAIDDKVIVFLVFKNYLYYAIRGGYSFIAYNYVVLYILVTYDFTGNNTFL